jgi:hypothetical protein
MPFIRGRYHMNPTVGDAIEAAREAEAALQALEHASKVARGDTADEEDADSYGNRAGSNASSAANAPGPIHRVEIEAAELVPSHSGRAQRGFVARIHRKPSIAAGNDGSDATYGASSAVVDANASANNNASSSAMAAPSRHYSAQLAPPPETHVFADHHDLTNFLRDQFSNDCK